MYTLFQKANSFLISFGVINIGVQTALLLANSWQQYKVNFKTALVFALLSVFVLAFASFQNVFVSSGSIFLDYNPSTALVLQLLALAALIALSLLFYSLFVSILVLGVRRNLSKLKLHFYISEMMQKFTCRVFLFYLLYCFLLFALAVLLLYLQVSILLINLVVLLVAVALLFVPQAIVVDEEGLLHAVHNNFEFIAGNKRSTLTIVVVGALLLAVLQLIEFAVDQVALVGALVSLFIALVFVLPFLEIMKTYLYMLKFDLIKEHEAAKSKKPPAKKPEPLDLAAAA